MNINWTLEASFPEIKVPEFCVKVNDIPDLEQKIAIIIFNESDLFEGPNDEYSPLCRLIRLIYTANEVLPKGQFKLKNNYTTWEFNNSWFDHIELAIDEFTDRVILIATIRADDEILHYEYSAGHSVDAFI